MMQMHGIDTAYKGESGEQLGELIQRDLME
jgi:hypothetical protein